VVPSPYKGKTPKISAKKMINGTMKRIYRFKTIVLSQIMPGGYSIVAKIYAGS